MDQFAKQKSIEIARGLFLVRYEAAESSKAPPRFLLTVDPNAADHVELILPPGADRPILWSPGACLVARATQAGRVVLAVAPSVPGGSTAGRIQLINLSHDPAGLCEEEGSVGELDLSGFRLLGHVAGIGDVLAGSGSWIAGPTSPSRIEGIAIQWSDKPHDLDLRYSITVGGPRPAMGQLVDAGHYAGTRGRALPLVGATFEISGGGAIGRQLVVDAIFLGSPQMKVEGQRVVLAGPSGREPMVGLRVRIESVRKSKSAEQVDAPIDRQDDQTPIERRLVKRYGSSTLPESQSKSNPVPTENHPAPKRSGRVRVFRSAARKT